MIKLGQLNTRMKDFYDIVILSRQFNFDGATLATAISETFRNRGTNVMASPSAFSIEFSSDTSKQTQWSAFLSKSKITDGPRSLAEVTLEISRFLQLVANAIERDIRFSGTWTPGDRWHST